MKKSKEVNEALKVLKENGFYTDFLWSTKDVDISIKNAKTKHFELLCSDKVKYKVLDYVLSDEELMEEIRNKLQYAVVVYYQDKGLIKQVYKKVRSAVFEGKKVKVTDIADDVYRLEFEDGTAWNSWACKIKGLKFID